MISELHKIILNIVKALEKMLMRRVTTVPPRNLLVVTVYILENARDESTLSLGFFPEKNSHFEKDYPSSGASPPARKYGKSTKTVEVLYAE